MQQACKDFYISCFLHIIQATVCGSVPLSEVEEGGTETPALEKVLSDTTRVLQQSIPYLSEMLKSGPCDRCTLFDIRMFILMH